MRVHHRRYLVTYIPEHVATQALGRHVLCLQAGNVWRVVRDELLLHWVVRVAADICEVLINLQEWMIVQLS